MTRYARAGNSQRHKRQPEEATSWEDFWQKKQSEENNKDLKANKTKIEKKKGKHGKGLNLSKKRKFNKLETKEENFENDTEDLNILPDTESNNDSNVLTKKQLKKAKKKMKLLELSKGESSSNNEKILDNENSDSIFNENEKNMDEEDLNVSSDTKVFSKKQLKQLENNTTMQKSNDSNSSCIQKDFERKKTLFMQKLETKRKQNGILLLPAKVERKLYIIKKRLREKGLPPATIKEIARKERRKEELKFRKSTSSKTCFNCRQMGHVLADCPMPMGESTQKSNQETGFCFKCGSSSHTSSKCHAKISGYPFATCFVCKEEGHISKDCPQNKHGIYIKGGKCNLCGNVNHLRKDCPTLKKNEAERVVVVHTINEAKSVDAEIIDEDTNVSVAYNKNEKKKKVVKF
ncbi:zinc finger CCHC domain-containing protein 9 [Caerostris darwini]|uniref:Zinc finger CCHC domain-containing protein 9 n=1 Tax=Caerostris darwini TaxID=1538125 RepID=A0AAV4QUC7_9ARAC|nr:zinc finger CCHC domain-containing protein 9 [Caerostris darwini]